MLLAVFAFASCHSGSKSPPSELELGRQVYLRRCYTCHQADGKGMMGSRQIAADLTASPGVLAKPDSVLSKTIKTGITGPIGKMPPLGPVMSDEEIALVLNYIRVTYQPKPVATSAP